MLLPASQVTKYSPPYCKCIYPFKHVQNTIALLIFKSVAGMAIGLTINYAKFAPLNVWNFAPYMSLWCYANFDPLNILSSS